MHATFAGERTLIAFPWSASAGGCTNRRPRALIQTGSDDSAAHESGLSLHNYAFRSSDQASAPPSRQGLTQTATRCIREGSPDDIGARKAARKRCRLIPEAVSA